MLILNTSTKDQTINIVPRKYVNNFYMIIRDDSTNTIVEYEISGATILGDYLSFSNSFNLIENRFYDLQLTDDSYFNRVIEDGGILESIGCIPKELRENANIIYKDRIFCTNQSVDQLDNDYYKLNKGQYSEYKGYDNTYIVI